MPSEPTEHITVTMPMDKITVTLPASMAATLRRRADEEGLTVSAVIRRAVKLEHMAYSDPTHEVVVRDRETGQELAIRVVPGPLPDR